MKHLKQLSPKELQQFLDSFDNILLDCDGVLLTLTKKAIAGSSDACNLFRKLNKKLGLVSNNSTRSLKMWQKMLADNGFQFELNELVSPMEAIIDFFKTKEFKKEIFVIGFTVFKEEMEAAGLKIAPNPINHVPEAIATFLSLINEDSSKIGAVVIDWDLNLNYASMLRCTNHLSNPDILFLVGGSDEVLPIGNKNIMGPGCVQNMISSFTRREPLRFGKPSKLLNDFIVKKCGTKDSKRTLFVGDSLKEDMMFADTCGYQKLIVLSGLTTIEKLNSLKEPEKPTYYIENLGELHRLILEKLPHIVPKL